MSFLHADNIENLLPQTQCTKCGYPGCRQYAEAIANGSANYNQCPPGGRQGIIKLAKYLNKPIIPLNPINGNEKSRFCAVIQEKKCIGCTLCIQSCPVDAIIGAAKHMHTIFSKLCTGCDLCIKKCPVNCIFMIEVTPGRTGWDAWSQKQADNARKRYYFRKKRIFREKKENYEKLKKVTIQFKKNNREDQKYLIESAMKRIEALKNKKN
ncbi:electron transport complex subunit RsxB [Candidatus Profftella armatura (Diaphorina cf. continua)]|uniref:Electron transport complex subunit RsxB n=1 Tax=Candidatus Profftella armatura (Diaphorina cf. continua) TaxID=2661583 RepID=A0A7R6VZW0_9PROT|nr:electron transport complex subunit RsxB [Candidatus Profftella armatura (Diaphorina cf. continua)]BCG49706.1 electron transport complex subunit RsxB [Candidatus Profftella armatura (Diaphorina cf. continua)]